MNAYERVGDGYFYNDVGASGYFVGRDLYKATNPSNLVLIADNVAIANLDYQYYYFDNTVYPVHLRHNGMANCLFIDGHVETAKKARLQECVINHVVDENGNFLNL